MQRLERTPTFSPTWTSWTTQCCLESRLKCMWTLVRMSARPAWLTSSIATSTLRLSWLDLLAIDSRVETVYRLTTSRSLISCSFGTLTRKVSSLPKLKSSALIRICYRLLNQSSTNSASRGSCVVRSSFRLSWCPRTSIAPPPSSATPYTRADDVRSHSQTIVTRAGHTATTI